MKLYVVIVFIGMWSKTESFGVADIISNYAKVAVNDGKQHVQNATTTLATNTSLASNEREDEDTPNYEDFDDTDAATERSQQSGVDTPTMLKYFNGLVNLLALMYQFNGSSRTIRPQSLHFSKSKPRNSESDPLADSINQLAEDRFHPTTATKKFKLQQGTYLPVDTYPPYNPFASSAAETYSSNGGKTSYDADASQYMIKSPMDMSATKEQKPSTSDSMELKNPMTEYMTQNDPVDIHPSYSYEVPQMSKKVKPMIDSVRPWQESAPKPEPEPEKGPLYYPWKSKPTMKMPPPEDTHPWYSGSQNEGEENSAPVYYPWMSKESKKSKPSAPTMDDSSQPWVMSQSRPVLMEDPPSLTDHHYYPWLSQGTLKSKLPLPSPPSPAEEESPDDEDDSPSWSMKPPGKSKPPKDNMGPPEDHIHPFPYYPHDNQELYHDDHDHPEEPEEDHQMKDEDRESKRPYTYYHLGRKLWYVPLLFSLYFIVYIASLLLKSIARHKVQFPEKLWELHDQDHHHHHDDHMRRRSIEETTQRVYDGLNSFNNKFL